MRRFLLPLVIATSTVGAQQAWPVDRSPIVVVRAEHDEVGLQFTEATSATRMPGGEVVIADATDNALRIADASGRVVRSFGRRGQGPGEFRTLVWVGQCGGSIYAWDVGGPRVAVFDLERGFTRQFMVDQANSPLAVACSPSGAFVTMTRNSPPPPADASGTTRNGTPYEVRRLMTGGVVVDSTGKVTGRLENLLWGEFISGPLGPGGRVGAMQRPLGGRTSLAFLGERVVVARSDSGTVDMYDLNGARVAGFRLRPEGAVPTAAQYEQAIPATIVGAPQQLREALIDFARSVPLPERTPAFTKVLTDPIGLVWVVRSFDGDRATRLAAHRADGSLVANVVIPASLTVLEIGRDYVLGRTEDEEGEIAVVVYRFRRG